MLATGGCGELYLYTTNSWLSGGDGFSIAYRAGAAIRDPEMIQFHPTAMFLPGYPEGEPLPLITEALRGDGSGLHTATDQAGFHTVLADTAVGRTLVGRAALGPAHMPN